MGKYIFISLLFLTACTGKEISIDGFDPEVWRKDEFGCNYNRQKVVQVLLKNKDQLQGLSNDDVIDYLGKPDRTELYTRNQKFFHYYISPGPECSGSEKTDPERLSLRFNATGLVKEITLYN